MEQLSWLLLLELMIAVLVQHLEEMFDGLDLLQHVFWNSRKIEDAFDDALILKSLQTTQMF